MTDSDPGAKARAELNDDKREKALVTILFSDVVGSTSYYEKYGDTAGMALVDRHTYIASRTFDEYNGTIVKTIGDGVMAVFTDAAKAVRAAVDMQRSMMLLNEHLPQRERIQLRIGINQGIGFRRGEDVFGDVVNFAARITKISVPGQVIISQGVYDAVRKQPDIVCHPLGDPEVKGKSNREELYEVIYTDPDSYKVLRAQVTQAIKVGDLVTRPERSAAEKVFAAAAAAPAPTPAPAPSAAPAPVIAENAIVSHYKLLEKVGSGGMGTVYRAEDTNIGRKVAVKFLDRKLMLADEAAVERFRREARTASALNHPNICRIYEIDEAQGMHYIVMELLEGQTLRQFMQKQRLPLMRLLDIAIDVSSALASAHYQDIVHRDIKPENIFITARGSAKLLDFGLAKLNPLRPWPSGEAETAEAPAERQLTSAGISLGTVPCMSPEQARGEDLDHRTDIFSLGTVLYEMATGLQPFRGSTPAVIFDGILNRAPTPVSQIAPELPPQLQNVIAKAMEKVRELRYQSTAQLAADLKVLRRDAGIAVEAPLMPVRAANLPTAKITQPVAAVAAPAAPSAFQRLAANMHVRIGAVAAVVAAIVLGFLALTSRPSEQEAKPQPPLVTTRPAAVVMPPPPAPEPELKADEETLKLIAVADAAEAQGDFATSLAAQEQFLRDRSENHFVRNHYARTLAHTKRFPEALTQYRMVLAAAPDDLDALIGAAKVTSWQGDLEGALRRFDEVLAKHPQNYDAAVGRAFTLMWMRRAVEAREAFRQLAEKNPHDTEVANALKSLAE
jgi:class 3 adenylate cyclase/tetratricopeptide (TPR) repeat protein